MAVGRCPPEVALAAHTRIAPRAARNEELKAADDGLNVRAHIETVYSRDGFASIPGEDLQGRMRWWSLYNRRRPGIDGGRTATLQPHELDDEYFMLRVRCDGGRLTLHQLRVIGEISTELARGTADITDRQNIQLHSVRIEDVPEMWRRLEAGNRVVRLKGGDPFVLGRGGEELLACLAAGVEVRVAPGVTSAFAAHDAALDWPALARLDGTLVLLMGLTRLTEHAAQLVELGTTRDQRTTIGTLADIGDRAAARAVRSPAVVVVGPVVTLAESFACTSSPRRDLRPGRPAALVPGG